MAPLQRLTVRPDRSERIDFLYHCPGCGMPHRLVARIRYGGTDSQCEVRLRDEPERLFGRCRRCKARFPKMTAAEFKERLTAGI